MYSNVDVVKHVLHSYHKITGKLLKFEDVIEYVTDRPGHDKKYWISTKKLDSFVKMDYTGFQSGVENTIASYVQTK
jgi:dTDP-glucose 4,6-dehydratase